VTERLRQQRYKKDQIRIRVNSIIIYLFFLAAHFYSTIWPLSEDDNFHFVNNLKGQLGEVEFNQEDSPTWGKNFFDIATVLEAKQWLRGPFQTFIASHGTYDGDQATPETDTTSYALAFGRIVGGVRIGQLRGPRLLCGEEKAKFTFGTSLDEPSHSSSEGVDQGASIEKIHCYPQFNLENEVKSPFGKKSDGRTSAHELFTWEGWNGTSTTRERNMALTSDTVSKSYRSYPSPGYSVILSAANWTQSEAVSLILYQYVHQYINLILTPKLIGGYLTIICLV